MDTAFPCCWIPRPAIYSANDHSTHDYDYENPVKTGEPDADGWYRVYYKCKKCGKINWQSHKDN